MVEIEQLLIFMRMNNVITELIDSLNRNEEIRQMICGWMTDCQ